MAKFSGRLTEGDIPKFINDFYSLDVSAETKVLIEPADDYPWFNVALEEKEGVDLLEELFKDGMLKHWRWDVVFSKE